MTRSKVALVARIGGLTAAAGFATAVVFTVISGFQYKMEEDRGLEPSYAPAWIVVGTETGLLLIVLGAAIAWGSMVGLLVERDRRQALRNAAPPSDSQGPPA